MAKANKKAPAPSPLPAPLAAPALDAEAIVGFFGDRSVLAHLIEYPGLGEWDHMTNYISATEVIDARDEKTVLNGDVIPAGVKVRPAAYLDENQFALLVGIRCTSAAHAGWVRKLRSQLNQPYDQPGVFDQVIGRTADPAYRGKHHPWFCNELGVWALQEAGIVPKTVLPPYRRTPSGACDMCQTTAGARIVAYRGETVRSLIVAAGFDLTTIRVLGMSSALATV